MEHWTKTTFGGCEMEAYIRDIAKMELEGGPLAGEARLIITQGEMIIEFNKSEGVEVSVDVEEDTYHLCFEEGPEYLSGLRLTLSKEQIEASVEGYFTGLFGLWLSVSDSRMRARLLMETVRREIDRVAQRA